jgi:hypothetical protein
LYLENVSLDDFTTEYKEFVNAASIDLPREVLFAKWIGNRASGLPEETWMNSEVIGRYMWGDYTALSYTWGDLAHTETIAVNGEPFQVTKNLYTALHHLRSGLNASYMIWVDAICINQEDLQERNLQVQRMQHIYAQAIFTLAWLGPEAEDSNMAMDLLKTLAKGEDMVKVNANTKEQPLEMIEDTYWIALHRFLHRPYWKRVWVLQEIIASHKTLRVACGDKILSIHDLSVAVMSMNNNLQAMKRVIKVAYQRASLLEPSLSILIICQRLVSLDAPSVEWRKRNHRLLLPRILHLSRTSDGLLDKEIANLIIPDYSLPTWKVFTSFCKAASGRLEILRQCAFEAPEETQLPSRVPNLMIPVINAPKPDVVYNTSMDIPAKFEFIEGDRCFFAVGFRVDTVDGLGSAFWEWERNQSSIVQATTEANAYGDDRAVRRALWRTLAAAGKDRDGNSTPEEWEWLLHIPLSHTWWRNDMLKESFSMFCQFLDRHRGMQVFGRGLKDWFFFEEDHFQDSSKASEILESYKQMISMYRLRMLMITAKGYLGVAPIAAQQKDIISILVGCSTPMILRPVAVEGFECLFVLVGECYIEGLMDGEALEWIETGKCQMEFLG